MKKIMKRFLIGLLACFLFVGCGAEDGAEDYVSGIPYSAEITSTLWDPAAGTLMITFHGVPENLEVQYWRLEYDDYIPVEDLKTKRSGYGWETKTFVTVRCQPPDAESGIQYFVAMRWENCVFRLIRACDCE